MSENTAGYFDEPPEEQIDNYEKRADGKWYIKAELEDAVATCGTPYIRTSVKLGDIEVELDPRKEQNIWGSQMENGEVYMSGVGDVNSKEKGSAARYNGDKPPMHFIPLRQQVLVFQGYSGYDADLGNFLAYLADWEEGRGEISTVVSMLGVDDLIEAAYVWQHGAEKYAAWNWTKGMAWSIPLACISRHIIEIVVGNEKDDESGRTHWGHVVCNLLMLEHFVRFFPEGDDRPPAEMFR